MDVRAPPGARREPQPVEAELPRPGRLGRDPGGERPTPLSLKALKALPELMGRKKVTVAEADTGLLYGSWRLLALAGPDLEPDAWTGRRTSSAC
jgi:hypothetical protein